MQKPITLNPGESGRVSFSFTPTEARVHNVSIDGLAGSFEALSPIPPLDVDLSVHIETLAETICPGSTINIVAVIHNKTAYRQSYNSDYYVNGEVICHSTYESIGPDATVHGICSYIVPDVGLYDVRVTVDGFEATTSFEAVEVPVGEPDMSIPLNIVTLDITAGQSSYCSTFVMNKGDGEGDISCDWFLDDVYKETDSAHLVPGGTAHFFLVTPVITAGQHTVRAEFVWDGHTVTRTGSFTAEAPEAPKPPAGVGTVWGCVYDKYTGAAIRNASLSITGVGELSLNSKKGCCYRITLDAGRSWDFWCKAPGYRTILFPITPRADDIIKRDFAMTPL